MNTNALDQTMPDADACPRCGEPLTAPSRLGLCPRCLMAVAMEPTAAPGQSPPEPPEPPPLDEVQAAFPQLEILALIGAGGMGVVYKARQKSLNRLVALKLLAPHRKTEPGFAERFSREAQALAALSHPNIVTIHDFGQAGGFFFLLMEFVAGVNLRQAIRAGRFTPEQALAIVPPICEALQTAHDAGIVHRDIKPENLLMDKAGNVKVADFGVARILGANDPLAPDPGGDGGLTAGAKLGTPKYMAPEQADRPGAVDHRADIYSLGAVLYEMLTGEPPQRLLQPPSKRVHIDVKLDEIVLRALDQSPERRYQTAAEFRSVLEEAAHQKDEEPASVRTEPNVEPDRGERLFWKRLIGATAIGSLLAAVVSFIASIPEPERFVVTGARLDQADRVAFDFEVPREHVDGGSIRIRLNKGGEVTKQGYGLDSSGRAVFALPTIDWDDELRFEVARELEAKSFLPVRIGQETMVELFRVNSADGTEITLQVGVKWKYRRTPLSRFPIPPASTLLFTLVGIGAAVWRWRLRGGSRRIPNRRFVKRGWLIAAGAAAALIAIGFIALPQLPDAAAIQIENQRLDGDMMRFTYTVTEPLGGWEVWLKTERWTGAGADSLLTASNSRLLSAGRVTKVEIPIQGIAGDGEAVSTGRASIGPNRLVRIRPRHGEAIFQCETTAGDEITSVLELRPKAAVPAAPAAQHYLRETETSIAGGEIRLALNEIMATEGYRLVLETRGVEAGWKSQETVQGDGFVPLDEMPDAPPGVVRHRLTKGGGGALRFQFPGVNPKAMEIANSLGGGANLIITPARPAILFDMENVATGERHFAALRLARNYDTKLPQIESLDPDAPLQFHAETRERSALGWLFIAAGAAAALVSLPILAGRIQMGEGCRKRLAGAFESDRTWREINRYGGKCLAAAGSTIAIVGAVGLFVPTHREEAFGIWATAAAAGAALAPLLLIRLKAHRLRGGRWSRLAGIAFSAALAIGIAVFLKEFVIAAYLVHGTSTAPEIPARSRVLVWKLGDAPRPGDLVIFRPTWTPPFDLLQTAPLRFEVAHFSGKNRFAGRVVECGAVTATVSRNGEDPMVVERAEIDGRIITVLCRGNQ